MIISRRKEFTVDNLNILSSHAGLTKEIAVSLEVFYICQTSGGVSEAQLIHQLHNQRLTPKDGGHQLHNQVRPAVKE